MSEAQEELNRQYTKAVIELGTLVYENDAIGAQMERNEQLIEKVKKTIKQLSKKANELQNSSMPSNQVELPGVNTVEATNE